ncbi:MAG: hypothetical protein DRQ59_09855 [Gammaproteobacteria bacterium]|nr:MAG: hypothetical protein DRQ59_09855 [Gammaproteobacteria bacterium]
MSNINITEQLTRLEILFSEQEHTIQSLSDIVARQSRQISNLSSDLKALDQRYQELKSELPAEFGEIEKPPHY